MEARKSLAERNGDLCICQNVRFLNVNCRIIYQLTLDGHFSLSMVGRVIPEGEGITFLGLFEL